MRIWDVHPGYLNRQSLLGEHRELHGIASILTQNKKGYSRHPETLRWKGYGWALRQRHALLAAEMALRGYQDRSPVLTRSARGDWPGEFIDPPARQFQLLRQKYRYTEPGRIPLPRDCQQLWSQHKYSVLARDPALYRRIGRSVAGMSGSSIEALALDLTMVIRSAPDPGGLFNALQHMWGYVAKYHDGPRHAVNVWSPRQLLEQVQQLTISSRQPYLLHSTALSELRIFL